MGAPVQSSLRRKCKVWLPPSDLDEKSGSDTYAGFYQPWSSTLPARNIRCASILSNFPYCRTQMSFPYELETNLSMISSSTPHTSHSYHLISVLQISLLNCCILGLALAVFPNHKSWLPHLGRFEFPSLFRSQLKYHISER